VNENVFIRYYEIYVKMFSWTIKILIGNYNRLLVRSEVRCVLMLIKRMNKKHVETLFHNIYFSNITRLHPR